ncbi:MAG: hypothetical protein ABI208_06520 [Ginsengibacter sp.]|jgi:ketosteroid isomerase-like protein
MYSNKNNLLFSSAIIALLLFTSCDYLKPPTAIEKPTIQEILQADQEFSDMSEQIGIKKAFLQFMSGDGIILRPKHVPLVGPDAIDYLSQVDDQEYTLSWKASGGEIAQSGDLGFTYGVYNLKVADTTLTGTYVNVWQKQKNGSWKYILNNTNESTRPNP